MSPLEIHILLYAYAVAEPLSNCLGEEVAKSSAVKDSLEWMIEDGLIKRVGNGQYRTSPRGDAHVEQLMKLPFPVQRWVAPS